MRLIIAGSRAYEPARIAPMLGYLVDKAEQLAGKGMVSVVLSGCAPGVDKAGEIFAVEEDVAIERYPADFAGLGRCAGPIRNAKMASVADALLLIWDGCSRGSADMLRKAKRAGLSIIVVRESTGADGARFTYRAIAGKATEPA